LALSYNEIVGVSIFQKHRKDQNALEIKNLTVRPDKRGRYIASFLLRNTEIEGGKEFKSKYVICDAKANNFAVRKFLLSNRYFVVAKRDLYELGAGDDLIYRKNISIV